MDEVGLAVRSIAPEGFVKFLPMSINWFDQPLVDQRGQIMTAKGPVAAVSGLIDKPRTHRGRHGAPATRKTRWRWELRPGI
jgi:putative aminopeptidase FrvX